MPAGKGLRAIVWRQIGRWVYEMALSWDIFEALSSAASLRSSEPAS
jgi:hypothetical protein